MRNTLYLLSAVWIAAACSSFGGEPPRGVKWKLESSVFEGAPGDAVKLVVYGAVPDGYWTYSSKKQAGVLNTDFNLEPDTVLTPAGEPTYSPPELKEDKELRTTVEIFHKTATFTVPYRISPLAGVGENKLILRVISQVCNEKLCVPDLFGREPLELTVKVAERKKPPPGVGIGIGNGFPPFGEQKAAMAWKLEPEVVEGRRGETVDLTLSGAVPEGYYTYSAKPAKTPQESTTLITVEPQSLLARNGKVAYPPPVVKTDQTGASVEIFEKSVVFTIPVLIKTSAAPGEHQAALTIDTSVCRDANPALKENAICVPDLQYVKFKLRISDAAPVKPKIERSEEDQKVVDAKEKGLLAYLLLAMGAGALALLTPCVFPMIPITVSFFTKRKHISRRRSIRDAGVYALGIVFTFTALGFFFTLAVPAISALFSGADPAAQRSASGINDFASNPWVSLFIALIFMVLAGSLFGFYELQLPTSLMNRLNASAGQGDGIGSVLVMGLVFSLTSFTCTVPFVGAVMLAATQGEWLWPFLGMVAFATVFSLPFFLLALFPAWLKSLPKSGGWLNSVKVVMGFVEVAAGLKYISNADLVLHWGLLTRPVFLGIWIVLALSTTAYLLGTFKFPHDSPVVQRSLFRWLSATSFAGVAVFLASGMFGSRLGIVEAFVPPTIHFEEDLDKAQEMARGTGKPLFMDFTGFT